MTSKSNVNQSVRFNNSKAENINDFHVRMNHAGESSLRATAKAMNHKISGTMRDCVACSKAKSHKKNTAKLAKDPATTVGYRLQVDISGPFHKGLGGSKYWLKVVDEYSKYSFDRYLKKKSELWLQVRSVVRTLRSLGHTMKTIRCDIAGENSEPLKKWCSENSGGHIFLEYTAPYTPQHNGIVERRFATDGKRAHAAMVHQGWKQSFIDIMWCEATFHARPRTDKNTP